MSAREKRRRGVDAVESRIERGTHTRAGTAIDISAPTPTWKRYVQQTN